MGIWYKITALFIKEVSFYILVVLKSCILTFTVLLSAQCYLTCVTIKSSPFLLLMVIRTSCRYRSFSLPYRFAVRWGWWGVREDRGIWYSFTTVTNLTNLIARTDRHLLAVITGCRPSGLSDIDYLTLVCVHIFIRACDGAVGCGTALRVRFPMTSLEFSIPSGLTIALGSTQPLTENSTRNI
jgi:hypothetical protein